MQELLGSGETALAWSISPKKKFVGRGIILNLGRSQESQNKVARLSNKTGIRGGAPSSLFSKLGFHTKWEYCVSSIPSLGDPTRPIDRDGRGTPLPS